MGLEDPNIFEMAKKAKANVAPFYRFPERIHQLPTQKEKLRQAKEESFIVHFQDEEKGLARIKSRIRSGRSLV